MAAFEDNYKKVGQTICDKFKESFKNPASLKIPGPPDTHLYSKEGVCIKVHRVRILFFIKIGLNFKFQIM